jgi:hypothetical protein
VGPPGRILPGLVQQRLLQLRQGAGDHHGRQEERDGQGGPLGLLHHHQDGRQQAEDIQREEPEISSSQPKEIEKCKTINERGPRLAYLVNRLDGSSLPTRTRALSSPSRPEEERNKAEVQEDEAERERKKRRKRKVRKNLIIVWRDLAEIMFTLIVKEWSLAWRQLLDVLRLRHHHHL